MALGLEGAQLVLEVRSLNLQVAQFLPVVVPRRSGTVEGVDLVVDVGEILFQGVDICLRQLSEVGDQLLREGVGDLLGAVLERRRRGDRQPLGLLIGDHVHLARQLCRRPPVVERVHDPPRHLSEGRPGRIAPQAAAPHAESARGRRLHVGRGGVRERVGSGGRRRRRRAKADQPSDRQRDQDAGDDRSSTDVAVRGCTPWRLCGITFPLNGSEVTDRCSCVRHAQLREDPRLVTFHRLVADPELAGDLLRREPLGDEREHLALAARERVGRLLRRCPPTG